jgi:sugar lactone lactonase YvrE
MQGEAMHKRAGLVLGFVAVISACSGEDSEEMGDACSSTGHGTLVFDFDLPDASLMPEIVVTPEGDGEAMTLSGAEHALPGGKYVLRARRARLPGNPVGPAFQGSIEVDGSVCLRDGQRTTVHVVYTKEPGSEKLWATNTNGDNPADQVIAFSAAHLTTAGAQEPDVTLDGKLTAPSALRVDALGRLWVGDTTGKLAAFNASRLAASSSDAPDIVLDGDALCGATLPCGPTALAFDRDGALWVALLERIVKLDPAALDASGQPEAAVTITSPDVAHPISLAFDVDGNLWVGDADSSGVAKFAAARLGANITNGAADVVIQGQKEGPVEIGLGTPDGLAFDLDGNLWVGYWGGNDLARYTPEELSATATLIPTVQFNLGATALLSDLAIDDLGNLWMPGVAGTIASVAADQLTAETPTVTTLQSGAIGSVEKIALHSVEGELFIAP